MPQFRPLSTDLPADAQPEMRIDKANSPVLSQINTNEAFTPANVITNEALSTGQTTPCNSCYFYSLSLIN